MNRRNLSHVFAIATAVMLLSGTTRLDAQAPAAPKLIPTKVDVVLTRFQGDKKVSSMPFTIYVNSTVTSDINRVRYVTLRMGVDVPVGTVTKTTTLNSNNTSNATTTEPQYRYVGTSIDCRAVQGEDGRFTVELNLQDSSIVTTDAEGRSIVRASDPLAFRTFTMQNALLLKDGQAQQFTMGTDKISGETLKVDVTITVVK
jgi:hypothetical protein